MDVLSAERDGAGGKLSAAGQVAGRVKTQRVTGGFPGVRKGARRHRQSPLRRLRAVQRGILRLQSEPLPALQMRILAGGQVAGTDG